MVIQFEEIVEKYLRPKALSENLDHSSWSDKAQVWVKLGNTNGSEACAFQLGTILEQNDRFSQVKLSSGKVNKAKAVNAR